MPRKGVKRADELALNGLAELWNKNRKIRETLLTTGFIFTWPTRAQVGVINFDTAALNVRVLSRLLRTWLPTIDILKSINIYAARREAWLLF